jgi:4-diphosphocytidyl-2-C-methyl-D-erythritol kinase
MLYDIPAPAKLNLFLHVTGRRADGYHLLQTVFRFIDLNDRLDIDVRPDGLICRETDMLGVPHDEDLVVRAAMALQSRTGCMLGAQIHLRKSIPSGGGLGGGSSDAASVLIALNRLWKTGLTRTELMRIGLTLGADVPVFIFGQNAFAEGIGEDLEAIELPARSYLVIQPAQNVPTLGIFQDPDLTRNTDPVKIMDFSGMMFGTAVVSGQFHNDLQPIVLKRYSVVRKAFDWCGSAGLNVRMTGSGACLFAEFAQKSGASLAHQKMIVKMRSDFSEFSHLKLPHVNVPPVKVPHADVPYSDLSHEEIPQFIRSVSVCDGLQEHPLRSWIES